MASTRSRLSRLLHAVDAGSSRAPVAVVVGALVLVALVALAVTGMPAGWVTAFSAVSGGVTLIMVFAIQHTQRREQSVTQLKLDELLKAQPDTDDRVVAAETSPDEELHEIREDHRRHWSGVRDGG